MVDEPGQVQADDDAQLQDCAAASAPTTTAALASLDAWRTQGARRFDPLRFDFLEALARRTAACEGATRQLLDDKLATVMSRYRDDCERAGHAFDVDVDADTAEAPQPARRAKAATPVPGALAQMLWQLEQRGPSAHAAGDAAIGAADAPIPQPKPAPQTKRPARTTGAKPKPQPEPVAPAAPVLPIGEAPEALSYFRRTWTRLDARRRLAQSQAKLPANAGPLNSQQLVHRALTLMQGAAPGYLHQLMAYVDALSSLEPFQPGAAAVPAEPARAETRAGNAPKKTSRTKRS